MQNKIEVANKVDEGFDIIQLIASWINFFRKKDSQSGVEVACDTFGYLGDKSIPGSSKITDKMKEELKEKVNMFQEHNNNLNNPDSYFDRIENGGIYGTPKIQIPANLQSNLNKNRPNFAINSYDPLVFDLNGDGKINLINSQTYFDYEGDGIKEAGYWLDKEDGFLVYDHNKNGNIDNGSELFGNFTLNSNNEFANNGYEALAQLDSDKNGIIDENDSEFANLKVWIDENSDGISQENELKTLSELEIQSLNLNATEVNQNLGNGNTLVLQGNYTKFDGTTAMSGDIDFSVNTIHREFKDELNLTAEQLARANVKGSGYLRDLKEACALSENLANLIDNYSI